MRISDWSSDVCSSDLLTPSEALRDRAYDFAERRLARIADIVLTEHDDRRRHRRAADARSGNDDFVVWDMIGSILRCFRVRFDDKTAGDGSREIGSASCRERVGEYV